MFNSNTTATEARLLLSGKDSVRSQVSAEEWIEEFYPQFVALQRKTKSKRQVNFPPEIWKIIKSYSLDTTFQLYPTKFTINSEKSKLYKSLPIRNPWTYANRLEDGHYKMNLNIEPYEKGTLRKGLKIVVEDGEYGFDIYQLEQSVSTKRLELPFQDYSIKAKKIGTSNCLSTTRISGKSSGFWRYQISYFSKDAQEDIEFNNNEFYHLFAGVLYRNQTEVLIEHTWIQKD